MTKKEKAKDSHLRRKYGIDLKKYKEMLKLQNYSCAICLKHQSNFKKSLCVDHNHKSGRVRALLCFFCNRRRVGQLNLKWAKAVYEYLLKYDLPEVN